MTGLFMGFIIALSTRSGNNNQELINNNSGLAIYNEWKWCETIGLIDEYPERASWEYYDTDHYIEWIYNRATENLSLW